MGLLLRSQVRPVFAFKLCMWTPLTLAGGLFWGSMYVYVHMHICKYVHMYVCNVCMYVCIYIYMYVCMYVRMYIYIYICMYACMYVCMYVCICTCLYVDTYIGIYNMILCMCPAWHDFAAKATPPQPEVKEAHTLSPRPHANEGC